MPIGKFFLHVHFIFLVTNKFLDTNYGQRPTVPPPLRMSMGMEWTRPTQRWWQGMMRGTVLPLCQASISLHGPTSLRRRRRSYTYSGYLTRIMYVSAQVMARSADKPQPATQQKMGNNPAPQ